MSTAQPQREYAVELPVGLAGANGEIHRQAVIRKMRGHEEALLYERDLGPGELVSQIIAGTLLRVGELNAPGADAAARMYSADRNYLLLQIRRVTLGDEMAAAYVCPSCSSDVRTIERLDEIEVTTLVDGEDPEHIEVQLEDGYADRAGKEHRTVVVRLPRGADEVFVAPMLGRDPMKAADALTLRCLVSFGAIPLAELQAYGMRILRDLTLGDRRRIHLALHENAPGAQFRRNVHCTACGARFERLLDVSDFFVPCWAGDTASGARSSIWPTTSTGPGARS